MISLGDNVSMPYAKWDAALGMPTASRFTKLITRGIYTPTELSKRSIAGGIILGWYKY